MRVALTFGDPARAAAYRDAASGAGLICEDNPPTLDEVAGLLLSGGTDVDPALYGDARHPETQAPDKPRDRLELRLLAEALQRDLPVLAICRGMQLVNVALGGTLIQHLRPMERHLQPRIAEAHGIDIAAHTPLAGIFPTGARAINSRHHQAIGRLAGGLRVNAQCPEDGVIEAVDLPGQRFLLAVQWHPEAPARYAADRSLFAAFAEAVRRS